MKASTLRSGFAWREQPTRHRPTPRHPVALRFDVDIAPCRGHWVVVLQLRLQGDWTWDVRSALEEKVIDNRSGARVLRSPAEQANAPQRPGPLYTSDLHRKVESLVRRCTRSVAAVPCCPAAARAASRKASGAGSGCSMIPCKPRPGISARRPVSSSASARSRRVDGIPTRLEAIAEDFDTHPDFRIARGDAAAFETTVANGLDK
jgi:hypothetical protein